MLLEQPKKIIKSLFHSASPTGMLRFYRDDSPGRARARRAFGALAPAPSPGHDQLVLVRENDLAFRRMFAFTSTQRREPLASIGVVNRN